MQVNSLFTANALRINDIESFNLSANNINTETLQTDNLVASNIFLPSGRSIVNDVQALIDANNCTCNSQLLNNPDANNIDDENVQLALTSINNELDCSINIWCLQDILMKIK